MQAAIGMTLACASALSSQAAPPSPAPAESAHTDRVIVRWKADVSKGAAAPSKGAVSAERSRAARLQEIAVDATTRAVRLERIVHRSRVLGVPLLAHRQMGDGSEVMRLPARWSRDAIERFKQQLLADPALSGEIADVLPDRLYFPQLVPADPLYASQWHLSQASGINMPAAWDISTGNPNLVIAILDTGMLPHNDLAGRWIGGYDFVSLAERSNDGNLRDADAIDPGDWVTAAEAATGQPLAGCLVTDSRWHGTTMAGIIAANANNAQGIAGINWNSKLLPVRVVGKCGGYESDIADGLRWSAGLSVAGVPDNPNPAKVVNMSLAAGGACSTVMQGAIDAVLSTHATIVAAAGNQSTNASGYSPGNCSQVITVGAVDKNGGKPTYTNFGANVTLSAPGGLTSADDASINILTTHNQGLTTANANNGYTRTTFGTSASAAQVTGIVSLMLGINPNLSPQEVKEILQNTSRTFPANTTIVMPNPSQADCTAALCGRGIPDAAKAIAAAGSWGTAVPMITAGSGFSAGLRADGHVLAWGDNFFGQLGNGTATAQLLPAPIPAFGGVTQVAANSRGIHMLAVRADGSVWSWGLNAYGMLGDGTTTQRAVPVRVQSLVDATMVSAGELHSLAVTRDGSVWAWGRGQNFDGTVSDALLPVKAPGLSGVVAVAAGSNHSLALKSDGTVWGWGYNSFGQLGLGGTGDTQYHSLPAQVPGLSGVIAIAGGENHSLALKGDGTVWAWGGNNSGELGDGTTTFRYSPEQVPGLTGISAIAAGGHSMARKSDGTVWTWGTNLSGQLGDGTTINRYVPAQVQGINAVVRVAAGGNHSLAQTIDGAIWAWGGNASGQLGFGDNVSQRLSSPVLNPPGTAGLNLSASATAFVPVVNALGATTQTSNAIVPAAVTPGSAISISGGQYSIDDGPFVSTAGTINPGQRVVVQVMSPATCGSVVTATLTIAGGTFPISVATAPCDATPNDIHFLGIADAVPGSVVTSNTATISGINQPVSISITGGSYSIGCTSSFVSGPGTINANQAVCVRQTASMANNALTTATLQVGTRSFEFAVFTLPALNFSATPAVAIGHDFSAALGKDGKILVWGANINGEFGNGTVEQATHPFPAPVSGLSGMTRIAAGSTYMLALHVGGTLWTWGDNSSGQLGDGGTIANNFRPRRVPITGSVTSMAGGISTSLAIKGDGTLWAWGDNSRGQLGDSTSTSRYSPVQVTGLSGVISAGAGALHSVAATSDGKVWVWGDNNSGQLGLGSVDNTARTTPVQLSGLSNVAAVASSYYHSLALTTDGTVWAWGEGSSGQLGEGIATYNGVPIQVAGLTGVIAIATGWAHSLALKSDGTVWTWGYNNFGQMGTGVVENSAQRQAFQVPGLSDVVAIAANDFQSMAIRNDGMVFGWGYNGFGNLGVATGFYQPTPVPQPNSSGTAYLNLSTGILSFGAVTGAALGSVQVSNTVTVTGVAAGSAISIAGGGQYSIDGAPFTSLSSTISPGQTVTLRVSASSACNSTITTTLSIAGVALPFSVTTAACDLTPDEVTFATRADVPLGTTQVSNAVTITGINAAAQISIAGGDYSIGCTATFSSVQSTITAGQTVCVRLTAPTANDALATLQLTVGTRTFPFTVMTPTATGFSATPRIIAGDVVVALRSDGHVWTWGTNSYGQLGRNGSGSVPGQVPGINGVKQIASLGLHVLALRSDGTVWAWGHNGFGEIGDGTTTNRPTPVQVPGLTGVTSIAAGEHSLALKGDGTVWAWGNNEQGQLGDGSQINRLSPVHVAGVSGVTAIAAGLWSTFVLKTDGTVQRVSITPYQIEVLSGVTAITSGDLHLLALKNDGTVWAYGSNQYGQLGDGTLTDQYVNAIQVPGLGNVTGIAASEHSLALKSDGSVWAWGRNTNGKLGDGTVLQRNSPVQVASLGSGNVVQVAAAFANSFALMNDGTLQAWGGIGNGQSGTGRYDNDAHPLPAPVPSPDENDDYFHLTGVGVRPRPFAFLAAFGADTLSYVSSSPFIVAGLAAGVSSPVSIAGGQFSVNGGAFTSTPGVVSNGDSLTIRVLSSSSFSTTNSAVLNIGGSSGRSSTFFVRTRPSGATAAIIPQAALGNSHSYVLNSAGTLFAVGYNGNGQLGNGTNLGSSALRPVAGLPRIIATASGAQHGLALKDDGTVAAWGFNAAGQLGHGIDRNSESNFVNVSSLANVVAIAAGDYHSLALKSDGSVWAWGLNVDGQIGQGNTATSRYPTPVQVTGLASVVAIAAGGRHNLAVLANGSVVAWGANGSGQLGDGTTTNRASPVAVLTLTSGVLNVAAGGAHSLALKSDSSVVSWGDNAFGQLGIGSQTNQSAPIAVSALGTGIALIAAGANHSLAVKAGGALFTWGANTNSQLGDGATGNRSLPFQVTNPPNVVAIAGGGRHSGAIDNRGKLFLWGDNFFGQVGNKSGNYNPNTATLNVLRGDSEISTVAQPAGTSTGTTSSSGSAVIEINEIATGYDFRTVTVSSAAAPALGKFKNQALTDAITGIGISVSGPGFTLQSTDCPSSLNASAECNFSIGFSPVAVGDAVGELQVASSLVGSPERRSLFGTGLAPGSPGIRVNATAGEAYLSFAPQPIGSPSMPANVVITNTGTVVLSISSASITTGASHFSVPGTCTTTISAGASCSLPVTFNPSAANAIDGRLTLVSNAGTVGVTLYGTGVGSGTTGIVLAGVVSRKNHGSAQTPNIRDLIIDRSKTVTQDVTVEPRMIGAGHQIVFQFNGAITNPGTATLTDQNGQTITIAQATTQASGNDVVVTITNLPDASRTTISLANVNGSNAANSAVAMGFLVGDVNGSGKVTGADIAGVKAKASPTVDAGNYKADFNFSGAVNSGDVSVVKSRAGNSLP